MCLLFFYRVKQVWEEVTKEKELPFSVLSLAASHRESVLHTVFFATMACVLRSVPLSIHREESDEERAAKAMQRRQKWRMDLVQREKALRKKITKAKELGIETNLLEGEVGSLQEAIKSLEQAAAKGGEGREEHILVVDGDNVTAKALPLLRPLVEAAQHSQHFQAFVEEVIDREEVRTNV